MGRSLGSPKVGFELQQLFLSIHQGKDYKLFRHTADGRQTVGNERHWHVYIPNGSLRLRITKLIPDHWCRKKKVPGVFKGIFLTQNRVKPIYHSVDISDWTYQFWGRYDWLMAFNISLILVSWNNGKFPFSIGNPFRYLKTRFYNCLLAFL